MEDWQCEFVRGAVELYIRPVYFATKERFSKTVHQFSQSTLFSEAQMTVDEVREKVYNIIVSKMGVSRDQIRDDAKFTDDLGADSLDNVELVMEFENQFGIQIPDEDAQNISTVKNAIDYIMQKKK